MKTYLVTIALLLINISLSFAQRCGGGIHSVKIYVLNGQKVNPLTYEVIPIEGNLNEILGENDTLSIYRKIYPGIILDSLKAKMILNLEKSRNKNVIITDSFKSLKYSDATIKGNVINGEINFLTGETRYHPTILRVSAQGLTVYVLGNFFGGCNKESILLFTATTVQHGSDIYKVKHFSLFNRPY